MHNKLKTRIKMARTLAQSKESKKLEAAKKKVAGTKEVEKTVKAPRVSASQKFDNCLQYVLDNKSLSVNKLVEDQI